MPWVLKWWHGDSQKGRSEVARSPYLNLLPVLLEAGFVFYCDAWRRKAPFLYLSSKTFGEIAISISEGQWYG